MHDMELTIALGLLLVDEVEALGLELAVDEGTSETGTSDDTVSKSNAHGVRRALT